MLAAHGLVAALAPSISACWPRCARTHAAFGAALFKVSIWTRQAMRR